MVHSQVWGSHPTCSYYPFPFPYLYDLPRWGQLQVQEKGGFHYQVQWLTRKVASGSKEGILQRPYILLWQSLEIPSSSAPYMFFSFENQLCWTIPTKWPCYKAKEGKKHSLFPEVKVPIFHIIYVVLLLLNKGEWDSFKQ